MNKSLSRYYARKLWIEVNGPIPKGMHLHHKDGNPFNNDISNLMICTPEEHIELHRQLGHKINDNFIAKADWYENLSEEDKLKFKERCSEYGKLNNRKWTAKQKLEAMARNSKVSKPIQMIELKSDKIIIEYPSIREAAKQLNIQRAHIRRVLNGQRKQWKGYIFKYIEG